MYLRTLCTNAVYECVSGLEWRGGAVKRPGAAVYAIITSFKCMTKSTTNADEGKTSNKLFKVKLD